MMRKFPILLALILTLILPTALAEDTAPYTPGDVTQSLFAEAFSRGDMLTLDMQFALDLSDKAEEIFGEDAAELAAVSELLENSLFSVGFGKVENGLRITLKGDYTVDAQTAFLDAALDLTETGVALSSSAIPGETITANWETLMSLAGMSEEEIASVMSLREKDFETLLAELVTALEPMLEMAAQIAAPYGQTILEHIAGLPMVANENVPAEAGYPAAATELQIQITDKAIGDLFVALANQLKQDATLCAMIDMMLSESATGTDPAPTTAQLCDAIIAAASEEFTDESLPYNIFIGMDASGNPLYLNLNKQLADGTFFLLSLISGSLEETGGSLISIDVLTLTAEQELMDGFSLGIAYAVDETNKNVMSTESVFSIYIGGKELVTFNLYADNAISPENPNGYDGLISMTMDATDGESILSTDMDANIFSLLTESGEELLVEGSLIIAADGEALASAFEGTLVTEVDGGMPVAVMNESLQMADLGIAQWSETYTLSAVPMAADEPMTMTALETASPEALEALAGRAMGNIEQMLTTLYEILPAELTETAS